MTSRPKIAILIALLLLLLLAGAGANLLMQKSVEFEDSEVASAPDEGSPAKVYADIPPEEVVQRAWAFYESRPYFQRPRPPSDVPAGLPDTKASTCGGCHTEIYEEWKLSTHRRAWLDDAQFMAELEKSRGGDDHQNDVGWMCVNCHTPSIEQLPELVVDLKDGQINQPIYA